MFVFPVILALVNAFLGNHEQYVNIVKTWGVTPSSFQWEKFKYEVLNYLSRIKEVWGRSTLTRESEKSSIWKNHLSKLQFAHLGNVQNTTVHLGGSLWEDECNASGSWWVISKCHHHWCCCWWKCFEHVITTLRKVKVMLFQLNPYVKRIGRWISICGDLTLFFDTSHIILNMLYMILGQCAVILVAYKISSSCIFTIENNELWCKNFLLFFSYSIFVSIKSFECFVN